MAAVITQPPAIVGSALMPGRMGTFSPLDIFNYEFTAPSRQYQVVISQDDFKVAVYKSTDGGATWVSQDAANRPAVFSGSQGCSSARRGNIFTICYPPSAGGGLRVITFDCSTDTFGAISAAGPTAKFGQSWMLQLPSNGDCYIYYARVPTIEIIYYQVFSGGVWGGEVQLTSEVSNSFPANVLLDPDERMHIFYRVLNTLKDITVLAGVIGAANVVRVGTGQDSFSELGQPAILGTDIILPYTFDEFNTGQALAAVIVGGPYNNPTTWAAPLVIDTIPTVSVNGADTTLCAVPSLDGLTVTVFWISLDYSSFPNPAGIIDQMWYSQNSGFGWGAPVLYYDAVTNPQLEDPGEDPFAQDLHTISVIALLNGTFGACTALEENGFCAGYYLVAEACDIVITVTPQAGGVPVVVPDNGEVFALPPAISGQSYPTQIIQGTEAAVPSASVEYTVVSGSPPPGVFVGGPVPAPTPQFPTPTTTTTVGIPVYGTPTNPVDPAVPTGPVTWTWHSQVRLTA